MLCSLSGLWLVLLFHVYFQPIVSVDENLIFQWGLSLRCTCEQHRLSRLKFSFSLILFYNYHDKIIYCNKSIQCKSLPCWDIMPSRTELCQAAHMYWKGATDIHFTIYIGLVNWGIIERLIDNLKIFSSHRPIYITYNLLIICFNYQLNTLCPYISHHLTLSVWQHGGVSTYMITYWGLLETYMSKI